MPEKVNLNTASKEELKQLEGINDSTAEAIIGAREQSGEFGNMDDLRRVEGISDKMIENLRYRVTL